MRIAFSVLVAIVVCTVALAGCGGGGGGAISGAATDAASLANYTAQDASSQNVTASKSLSLVLFGKPGANVAATLSKYGCYLARVVDPNEVAVFRQQNPRGLVTLYQMGPAVGYEPWAYDYPCDPVGIVEMTKSHPDWFLLDEQGNKIPFAQGAKFYATDPGNVAYQKAWADGAIANAKKIGADGIMMDSANSFTAWNFPQKPAKYKTDAAYAAAMEAFLRYIAGRLHEAGLILVPNGSTETWNTGNWGSWVDFVDGRTFEPPGGTMSALWETEQLWMDLKASYEARPDKVYIHFLPDPSKFPDKALFSVASFLIWQGPRSYVGCPFSDVGEPPTPPLADLRIGKPTAVSDKVGANTWHRAYEQGEVYVNPSATATDTITVPAGFKNAVTGDTVSGGRQTLGPRGVLVLIKTASAPATM